MNIRIKGIGLIEDSTVTFDGLTVLTGANSTGKSTLGKLLYSTIQATTNIKMRARKERIYLIFVLYQKLADTINGVTSMFAKPSAGNRGLSNFIREDKQFDDEFKSSFNQWLDDLLSEIETKRLGYENACKNHLARINKNIEDGYKRLYIKQIDIFISEFKVTVNKFKSADFNLHKYLDSNLSRSLQCQFGEDLLHKSNPDPTASIQFSDTVNQYPPIDISSGKANHPKNEIVYLSPFDKVYFIDNAFALDDVQYFDDTTQTKPDGFLSYRKDFIKHLSKTISNPYYLTVYEELGLRESIQEVIDKINEILPGSIHFSGSNLMYNNSTFSLSANNLATGSKMFSILKVLLTAGELNSNTQLILDEPEAHLHPCWQNKIAEIIVILVKYLKVNILLTTHSPNFMLAIDAYMRKYDISDMCNFYQTERKENGLIDYNCVNDDMGIIYDDFVAFLTEMNILRDLNM